LRCTFPLTYLEWGKEKGKKKAAIPPGYGKGRKKSGKRKEKKNAVTGERRERKLDLSHLNQQKKGEGGEKEREGGPTISISELHWKREEGEGEKEKLYFKVLGREKGGKNLARIKERGKRVKRTLSHQCRKRRKKKKALLT